MSDKTNAGRRIFFPGLLSTAEMNTEVAQKGLEIALLFKEVTRAGIVVLNKC